MAGSLPGPRERTHSESSSSKPARSPPCPPPRSGRASQTGAPLPRSSQSAGRGGARQAASAAAAGGAASLPSRACSRGSEAAERDQQRASQQRRPSTHLDRKLVPRKEEDGADLLKDGQHLLGVAGAQSRGQQQPAAGAAAGGNRSGRRQPLPNPSPPPKTRLLHGLGKRGRVDGVCAAVQGHKRVRHARQPLLLAVACVCRCRHGGRDLRERRQRRRRQVAGERRAAAGGVGLLLQAMPLAGTPPSPQAPPAGQQRPAVKPCCNRETETLAGRAGPCCSPAMCGAAHLLQLRSEGTPGAPAAARGRTAKRGGRWGARPGLPGRRGEA